MISNQIMCLILILNLHFAFVFDSTNFEPNINFNLNKPEQDTTKQTDDTYVANIFSRIEDHSKEPPLQVVTTTTPVVVVTPITTPKPIRQRIPFVFTFLYLFGK